MMPNVGRAFALATSVALGLMAAAGCTTASYCFANCDGTTNSGGSSTTAGAGGDDSIIMVGNGGDVSVLPDGGVVGCSLRQEACNGLDDNCNGQIDEGIDFKDPLQCGTCANNCRALLQNVVQDSITCTPPATADLGSVAGKCNATTCAADFWDIDGNPSNGCEYYCTANPTRAAIVDADNNGICGVDDDCDGKIDEDLDTTSDPKNCGGCGLSCVVANGSGKCVAGICTTNQCDDGWWNPPGGEGCWYKCTPTNGGKEICDGIDNDCDNLIDNADDDLVTAEPTVGQKCQGGDQGVCADVANAGILKCAATGTASVVGVVCCDADSNNVPAKDPNLPKTGLRNGECTGKVAPLVVRPGQRSETCNGVDDNCNGLVDDQVIDVGQVCGSATGICNLGVNQCVSGKSVCVGGTPPATDSGGNPIDPCNGVDDNCDGVIDGIIPTATATVKCTSNAQCSGGTLCLARTSAADRVCATPPPEVGQTCNPPPAAPCVDATGQEVLCTAPGAKKVPQPCAAGALTCSGQLFCRGTTTSTLTKDRCGEDSNCDGRLDGQPDFSNDVTNCGACGNDCNAKGAHVNWTCAAGICTIGPTKCRPGFIDCDGNANDCERACTPSGAELCNGFDDNCNCQVDEGVTPPSPSQVCGVSGTASDPKCGSGNGTTGVKVACGAGKWTCTFPPGYCNQGTPPACSTTIDNCDGLDNNCNGAVDESYKLPVLATGYVGQPCASDDGKAPPGDGACRGTGAFQCGTTTTTKCSAVRNVAAAGPELCDGVDNDCDGSVDEPFSAKGTNATFFVKPAVVQVTAGVFMYQYEASRPNASATTAGSGNGYTCTAGNCAAGIPVAPAGVTLDKTPACSVPGKIPWFNVTPTEVEETCTAMGGSVCTTANFTTACTDGAAACQWGYGANCQNPANYATGPFCNLGAFDFDGVAGAPNTDGLLVTNSNRLNQCWANYGATPATTGVFDLTGNLREITKRNPGDYPLMGGAFDTDAETGAACGFTFYSVTATFKLFDTGFRCCFAQNPTQ